MDSKDWQAGLTPDLIETVSKGTYGFATTNQETINHGLWDDLHGNLLAVPLAAWALAGRTVKWHGAVAARLVVENVSGEHFVVGWSGALLEAPKQASMEEDAQLSLIALDLFYASIPHYEDKVLIINTDSQLWRYLNGQEAAVDKVKIAVSNASGQENKNDSSFQMDVVFVHGLYGGPFKTWRISDNKTPSTDRAGLVEKIDVDTGKEGMCWPKEWLSRDIPTCRLLTVKYKVYLMISSLLLNLQVFYRCPHFGSKLADVPWLQDLVL
ncbi:hypothetical protein L7F22_023864 [Adiantum nelumboides]|nr:hypothetical protein [Adiantum nelumboides]